MKLSACFGIRRNSIPDDALREIEQLSSTTANPREVSFRFAVPPGSPAEEEVTRILHRCGKRPWDLFSPRDRQSEYEYSLVREFDSDDLEQAELFWLDPLPEADPLRLIRHEDGLPVVDRAVRRGVGYIEGSRQWIVLGEDVRAELEADGALVNADLKRLRTRNAAMLAGWELGSARDLPPMSSSMRWRDFITGEWLSEYRPGAIPSERPTTPALFRYRRRDIEAFGPFDVARAHESFSLSLDRLCCPWIVSKRFWRSFVCRGFQGRFLPVVLEV